MAMDVSITIEGIECIHISEFSKMLGRSVPSIRYLIEEGNAVRRLSSIRIGSRIYIPRFEITGYPFSVAGPGVVKDIYHYVPKDGRYIKQLCEECTYGHGCALAQEAATKANSVPKGDD